MVDTEANFTEPEAAKHLKVSRITLQRRRLAGEIAFYRIGSRVVYSTAHLQDFLARQERNGTSSRLDHSAKGAA